jgi:hypothetical protein
LLIVLLLLLISNNTLSSHTFFSQVIIWGHPLHSHTHSYIHAAFYRAFKYLTYEIYRISSLEELTALNIDLHKTLFLTKGQVDEAIPKRTDCFYILHNCRYDSYKELFDNNRCITLQVYTHDCLPYAQEKIDEYIYSNTKEKIVFMP